MKLITDSAKSMVMISVVGALLQIPILYLGDATLKRWIFCSSCLVVLPPLLYGIAKIRSLSVTRLFWVLLLCYVGVHLTFEFLVYKTGLRAEMDTGAFVQSFWNFIKHGAFETTVDGQYSFIAPKALNHFGRHNSPILFLALIPFSLYPDLTTLIVVKTLLLATTGWLAMKWVLLVIPDAKSQPVSAFLPFVLLLQIPFLLITDFTEAPFFPPLLLWSALAFRLHRKWQFAISCLLLSAVKETMLPVLLMWSAIAFIKKRGVAFTVVPIAIGVISFALSFLWIIPHYSATNSSPFLSDIIPALQSLNVSRIASYCVQVLCSWGWMPLGSPMSFLALPDVIVNAFFSGPRPWVIDFGERYQLAVAGGCFLGMIETLPRLARFLETRYRLRNVQPLLIVLAVTLSVSGLHRADEWGRQIWDHLHKDWASDMECIRLVSSSSEPVVADWRICAYFAKRDELWSYTPSALPLPEKVFPRVVWYVGDKSRSTQHAAVAGWDTVCTGETIFVLKRPKTEGQQGLSRDSK
jgi:uncharacterized membrane protein